MLFRSEHPFLREYARVTGYNLHFRDASDVRRALACYYALVSSLDERLGRILAALRDARISRPTRVLYLSDHGDNLGARGLWGKSTLYEESVGIPMILSGPGVAAGKVDDTPVGHVDVYNTVLDAVGIPAEVGTASPHSCSLLSELDPARSVFAEYHTVGSRSGIFMLRDRSTKYVHYEGLPDQLFDLAADPEERVDLVAARGGEPETAALLAQWRRALQARCDPAEVDRRAKQRQAELLEYFGGIAAANAGSGIGGFTPAPKP